MQSAATCMLARTLSVISYYSYPPFISHQRLVYGDTLAWLLSSNSFSIRHIRQSCQEPALHMLGFLSCQSKLYGSDLKRHTGPTRRQALYSPMLACLWFINSRLVMGNSSSWLVLGHPRRSHTATCWEVLLMTSLYLPPVLQNFFGWGFVRCGDVEVLRVGRCDCVDTTRGWLIEPHLNTVCTPFIYIYTIAFLVCRCNRCFYMLDLEFL